METTPGRKKSLSHNAKLTPGANQGVAGSGGGPDRGEFGARRRPRVAAGIAEDGVISFENVGLRYGLGPEVLRDLQ